MGKDMSVENIRFFLEHYFVQSFSYDDLKNLVFDFRYASNLSKEKKADKMLKECLALKELNDWNYVSPLLETDDQFYTPKRAKEFVNDLIKYLTDEEFDPENYKPFF
jgi:hypothetical protein